MRASRRGGLTLAEILMACFLFGLFTTMVARAAVMAYQTHGRQTEKVFRYRHACIAMNLLGRELQQCKFLIVPSVGPWGYGQAYTPGNDHFTSLQFFRPDIGQGWYLCEWMFDKPSKRVVRHQYVGIQPPAGLAPAGFDSWSPGVLTASHLPPWEPGGGRLMMEDVERFEIFHLDQPNVRFLRVEAKIKNMASTILTEVSVREL